MRGRVERQERKQKEIKDKRKERHGIKEAKGGCLEGKDWCKGKKTREEQSKRLVVKGKKDDGGHGLGVLEGEMRVKVGKGIKERWKSDEKCGEKEEEVGKGQGVGSGQSQLFLTTVTLSSGSLPLPPQYTHTHMHTHSLPRVLVCVCVCLRTRLLTCDRIEPSAALPFAAHRRLFCEP